MRKGGFRATQMLRLSGNYQIIVMYNISMAIKGISLSRACTVGTGYCFQVACKQPSTSRVSKGHNSRTQLYPMPSDCVCVCVQSTATLDCPAGLPFDFARLSIHCIIVISHPLSPALHCPALTGGCLLSPLIVDLAFLGSFFFRVFSLFM